MIKCKNCIHLKEDEQENYECLKIFNVVIYDKEYEHNCSQYKDKPERIYHNPIQGWCLTRASPTDKEYLLTEVKEHCNMDALKKKTAKNARR